MTDRADDATDADAPEEATEATKREGHAVSERGSRRRDDKVELTRGTLIGRYVVLEKLGEGGMGIVYSAFDPELDREVAIKLMQARPGGSQGEQAWLLREAQALARLAHPNVVGVHDVGTLPGDRVFVAMEQVDGLTLRDRSSCSPRPSSPQVMRPLQRRTQNAPRRSRTRLGSASTSCVRSSAC